jgi:hypothetical protein
MHQQRTQRVHANVYEKNMRASNETIERTSKRLFFFLPWGEGGEWIF